MPRENKATKRVAVREEKPTARVNLESLKHLPPELIEAIVPLSIGMVKQFQKTLSDTLTYLDKGVGDRSRITNQLTASYEALCNIDRRLNNGDHNVRNTRTVISQHKSVVSAIRKRTDGDRG